MSFLKGITPRGYLVMVLASFGALLFGFDNGWWGTVLGEQTFLCDYGGEVTVKGVTTCSLSTSQQSAGSGVQSAGVSEYQVIQFGQPGSAGSLYVDVNR
jgi:hypothetical protein